MISKKIMIIGAGLGQVPAINTAKAMGLYVVAVDKDGNAPGMYLADKSLLIDIVDIDQVLEAAKTEKIDGIMTMQSDIGVPTVGKVNEILRLTGVTYKVAMDCSNKWRTSEILLQSGVNTPQTMTSDDYNTIDTTKIVYPAIVKPADSSGSRGVTKILNEATLKKAVDHAMTYSRSKQIIISEFIEGTEVGAQTFSVGGECKLVLVHNDTVSSPPYYVPTGHSYPSTLSDKTHDQVVLETKRAVEALGIADGPANVDIIISKQGKPYIIEIGARIGATCLPELTSYYTGINWIRSTIESAIGIVPKLELNKPRACAAMVISSPADGILRDISYDKAILDDPDLLELEITAKTGDQISILRKGTDRIGKLVVKGSTAEIAESEIRKINSQLQIVVEKA